MESLNSMSRRSVEKGVGHLSVMVGSVSMVSVVRSISGAACGDLCVEVNGVDSFLL